MEGRGWLYLGFVSNKNICKTENVADKPWFIDSRRLNKRDIGCLINDGGSDVKLPGWWAIYYSDVLTSAIAFQTTGVWIVYSTVCSGADQGKHHNFASPKTNYLDIMYWASLAFVGGIHRWHKGPVTRKCFHLMTSSWMILLLVILSIINYYITKIVCWSEILYTNHLKASICTVVPLLIESSGHGVIDNPITNWVWFQHHFLGANETR